MPVVKRGVPFVRRLLYLYLSIYLLSSDHESPSVPPHRLLLLVGSVPSQDLAQVSVERVASHVAHAHAPLADLLRRQLVAGSPRA